MDVVRALIRRHRSSLSWMLHPTRSISVAKLDPHAKRWVKTSDAPGVERRELTLMTYNIWFDDYFSTERYRTIADMLLSQEPDIAVFQEVTPAALSEFLAQPWIEQNYYAAAAVGNEYGNYGLLMLSRLPLSRVSYNRLPTRLQRGFLRAELTVNGSPLVLCSIHLDSGKGASRLRARQLRKVFRALRADDDAVILGDFNMRDAENELITQPYIDVWPALRPDDDGYTEDTAINLMRWDTKNKSRQVRFDRVLLKGARWSVAEIKLVGTEPISAALPRVFPSDHFGVLCRVAAQGFSRTTSI